MSIPYPITRVERIEGRIRHWLREHGQDVFRDYDDVRLSLCWEPPFFLCVGEESLDPYWHDQTARGVLRVLCEHGESNLSIASFLDKLTDAAALYGCSTVYGETGERFKAYVDSYWQYLDKRHLRLDLLEAPWSGDFGLLVRKTQDAINQGLLYIHRDSETSQDLQSFTMMDLENGAEKFYRLKALGFAVGSFEKFMPRRLTFKPSKDFFGSTSWTK